MTVVSRAAIDGPLTDGFRNFSCEVKAEWFVAGRELAERRDI